jgi:hypothetical protein
VFSRGKCAEAVIFGRGEVYRRIPRVLDDGVRLAVDRNMCECILRCGDGADSGQQVVRSGAFGHGSLAPAVEATWAYTSKSNDVRTRTRELLPEAVMRRVASMPSTPSLLGHQDHIGAKIGCFWHGFLVMGDLAHNRDVRDAVQECALTEAVYRLIVNDEPSVMIFPR